MQIPPSEASAIQREETCVIATVRRVAAMLDSDPESFRTGDLLPRGWHFILLAADTRRSSLRADGFPGLGVPIPDLGLPRLMLGSRDVTYFADIPIGAHLQRSSAVTGIEHKTSKSGPLAVVTLSHEICLTQSGQKVVGESQRYLLMPARERSAPMTEVAAAIPTTHTHTKTVVPDATMLFQYSALGFNSHRIHIDRQHAIEVEGFPDLVVNGGLVTLMLTEFLRCDLGLIPLSMKVRHLNPLYCNRPLTLAADFDDQGWKLQALDDQNRLAVVMEVTVQ